MNNNYNDDNDKREEESHDNFFKKGSKMLGRGAGKTAKKTGDIMKKIIMAGIKALGIKLFIPIIIVLSIVLVTYYVEHEFTGTQKEYSKRYDNDLEYDEDKRRHTVKEDGFIPKNKVVNDFYKYMSGVSYHQIAPIYKLNKNNEKDEKTYQEWKEKEKEVINMDHEDAVKDFHGREKQFGLSADLLFALDRYVFFDKDIRFPEQFIRPVYFDKEKLELKPLTDEYKNVISPSKERDLETGEETGKEIKSVRDYGLGSVMSYLEATRYLTVEGRYIKEDYWDGEKVAQRKVDIPFKVPLASKPQEKIHLLDRVISFVGEVQYEYKNEKWQTEDVVRCGVNGGEACESSIEGVPVEKYHYATHYEERCSGSGENKKCTEIEYKLYRYRDDSSGVYELMPRPDGTKKEDKGHDYYYDYLDNIEAYIFNDVIGDEELIDRIDYDSHSFDFELGTGTESNKFLKAYNKAFDSCKKWGEEFGVDPYVLLAMMTQESGASTSHPDGPMQITQRPPLTISAPDATGKTQTFTLTNKQDIDQSAHFIAMKMKNALQRYDGNIYKAILSHNYGDGGLRRLAKVAGPAWFTETGWVAYMEESRRQTAIANGHIGIGGLPKASASQHCMDKQIVSKEMNLISKKGNLYGDACYLDNVLQYYAGGDNIALEGAGSSVPSGITDMIGGFGGMFKNFLSKGYQWLLGPEDLDEDYEFPGIFEFKRDLNVDIPDQIIKTTKALTEDLLYSETDNTSVSMSFWDYGFMKAPDSKGLSYDQLLDYLPHDEGFISPVVWKAGYRISSRFGPRKSPTAGASSNHKGIDIAAPIGEPIYAVASGRIKSAHHSTSGGKMIVIEHGNGLVTRYLHMNAFGPNISAGQEVSQGQYLGEIGNTGYSTGPHLHFDINYQGVYYDPEPIIQHGINELKGTPVEDRN